MSEQYFPTITPQQWREIAKKEVEADLRMLRKILAKRHDEPKKTTKKGAIRK